MTTTRTRTTTTTTTKTTITTAQQMGLLVAEWWLSVFLFLNWSCFCCCLKRWQSKRPAGRCSVRPNALSSWLVWMAMVLALAWRCAEEAGGSSSELWDPWPKMWCWRWDVASKANVDYLRMPWFHTIDRLHNDVMPWFHTIDRLHNDVMPWFHTIDRLHNDVMPWFQTIDRLL